MSYQTPWSGELEEGTYEIAMPAQVIVGSDTYTFKQWEDGSTNPTRVINLTAPLTVNATYELVSGPPPPPPPPPPTPIVPVAAGLLTLGIIFYLALRG